MKPFLCLVILILLILVVLGSDFDPICATTGRHVVCRGLPDDEPVENDNSCSTLEADPSSLSFCPGKVRCSISFGGLKISNSMTMYCFSASLYDGPNTFYGTDLTVQKGRYPILHFPVSEISATLVVLEPVENPSLHYAIYSASPLMIHANSTPLIGGHIMDFCRSSILKFMDLSCPIMSNVSLDCCLPVPFIEEMICAKFPDVSIIIIVFWRNCN